MRSSGLFVVFFVVALGCGEGLPFFDDGDAGADADAEVDAGPFVPGPHGALPQATSASGTVLAAPKVVPIFFANDLLQAGDEGFLAQLPSSSYWSALESEYGVGPLTIAPSIVLSDAPPATASDTDVIAFIASKLGSDPSWPAPTPDTIYFVYYPASTTLTYAPSYTSCVDFAGYHFYGETSSATPFVYAVVARCNNGQTPIDADTEIASHEIVEAATDPLLLTYATTDAPHAVWSIFPGGEVGDLCELEPLSYQRIVGSSMVQRFWSNSAAAAGHDPCAPAASYAYFNAVPVLPDQVSFDATTLADAVVVPVGTNKTIDVQLYSDAPTSDWSVEADDATSFGGAPAGELQFLFSKSRGNNGDTLQLTIYRVKDGAYGGTEFVIHSYQSPEVWHEYFAWASN